MNSIDWKDHPKNAELRQGLRGDVFSFCENCLTRTHFQVDRRGGGQHRYTCHTCGRLDTRRSLCKLPREIKIEHL